MGQCAHGRLGRADVHQVQTSAGDHYRVQLAVDVGELQQVGVAELLEQVGGAEGFGLASRDRRGVQDALPDRGLQPSALPLQRGRRRPAVQGAVQTGGDVAQRGQVGRQLGVGRRAHRGDPEHGAPPAFAPFQEQPGVPSAHPVPQGHSRQPSAVSGSQGPQFGGAERLQVQVKHGQAAVASGQHAPPAFLRLAPRRLGQPAGAAGARRAAVSGRGGGLKMAGGLAASAAGQRDPSGEQVGFDGARWVQFVQPRGHPQGRLQQRGRTLLVLREPAQQQHKLGPRRPPRALLTAEQPQRLGAALLCQAEVAGRAGGQCGGMQQFGAPHRRAVIPLDPSQRRVDLAQGIRRQTGREQHRALVDEELGVKDAKLVEQRLGVVEVGERGGEVAPGVCGQSALFAHVRVLQLLTAFGPQRLDPGVVPVGPLDIAHGQVHRCSPVQGTRFPDQIASAGEQVDGGLGVPQGLSVAAQDVADSGPADQDPTGEDAVASLQHGIQNRQPAPRLPGQNQGGAQAGRDIRFPVKIPGLTREPACILELFDRFTDITEVSENHPGGLVRDGGLRRRRVPGQHLTGSGQSLRRPGQGQGQQLVWLPDRRNGVRDGRHLRIVFSASAFRRDHISRGGAHAGRWPYASSGAADPGKAR